MVLFLARRRSIIASIRRRPRARRGSPARMRAPVWAWRRSSAAGTAPGYRRAAGPLKQPDSGDPARPRRGAPHLGLSARGRRAGSTRAVGWCLASRIRQHRATAASPGPAGAGGGDRQKARALQAGMRLGVMRSKPAGGHQRGPAAPRSALFGHCFITLLQALDPCLAADRAADLRGAARAVPRRGGWPLSARRPTE
jgi:hypothetical protein